MTHDIRTPMAGSIRGNHLLLPAEMHELKRERRMMITPFIPTTSWRCYLLTGEGLQAIIDEAVAAAPLPSGEWETDSGFERSIIWMLFLSGDITEMPVHRHRIKLPFLQQVCAGKMWFVSLPGYTLVTADAPSLNTDNNTLSTADNI